MLNILKEAYFDRNNANSEGEDLKRLLETNKNKLTERLDAEEKILFEKYINCFEDLLEITVKKEFERGVKAGGRIIVGILSDF